MSVQVWLVEELVSVPNLASAGQPAEDGHDEANYSIKAST
jgi:hypothetical protein